MKRILGIVLGLFVFCQVQNIYAVDEFLSGEPEGAQNISAIDDLVEDNNIALERLLAHARRGCEVSYASASTLTVQIGEVACSNSDASILKMRINTSTVTITWSDLDTGSEENSETYYVFAVGDADTTTFTCKITKSSTAPSGVTYYKRLGSFYNNSSGNIERIDNQDLGVWEQDSDEIQLKQADEIDMRDQKIINLATPTADADAGTKAYIDSVAAGTAIWEVDGTEHQLVTADEIDMQSKRFINVTDPISDQDGATMKYVDDNKNVDGAVTQAKLATTTGEASTSSNNTNLTLPGGTYGFFPQIKLSASGGVDAQIAFNDSTITTSYVTNVGIGGNAEANTVYLQQRYVTASGIDYWPFLLLDKSTKEIISCWGAEDHPSYGNGGDYMKLPHPFNSYDSSIHYIVLIEKVQTEALRVIAEEQEITLLSLINEDYKIDWLSAPKYVPLHTGKFLGEEPILVPEIPDYIKMKNLVALTDQEKVARDTARDTAKNAQEQAEIDKETNSISAKDKLKVLGLTDDEINAIIK